MQTVSHCERAFAAAGFRMPEIEDLSERVVQLGAWPAGSPSKAERAHLGQGADSAGSRAQRMHDGSRNLMTVPVSVVLVCE